MNIFEFAIARKFAQLLKTADERTLEPAECKLMTVLELYVTQYEACQKEKRQ